MLGTLTCGLVQCSRMDAAAVNGEEAPGTNGGLSAEEQERQRMRPADVDADMREMARRKRVDAILNSKTFRVELDRLVEAGVIDGSSVGGCLQHISDMMGLDRAGDTPRGVQCVQPIADLRGAEASQFTQQEKQLRCQLASLLRVMDQQGWAPPPHAHVTVRLSDSPDHLLVNPHGLLYGEVTASSLMKVDLQGNTKHPGSSGLGVRASEFAQLAAVHAARPELRCVIQVRAAPVVAVSALRSGLLPLTDDAAVLGQVALHTPTGSGEPGRLAADLGTTAQVVLVQNKGALCCGETVEEAFYLLSCLIAACENQVRMLPLGADSLLLLDEQQQLQAYEAARRTPAPAAGGAETARPWRLGELQFEALMRQLDSAGFRTGHVYRHTATEPDGEQSAAGYSLDTDDIFKYSPMRKMVAGARAGERTRWLNQYQKMEMESTTTSTTTKQAGRGGVTVAPNQLQPGGETALDTPSELVNRWRQERFRAPRTGEVRQLRVSERQYPELVQLPSVPLLPPSDNQTLGTVASQPPSVKDAADSRRRPISVCSGPTIFEGRPTLSYSARSPRASRQIPTGIREGHGVYLSAQDAPAVRKPKSSVSFADEKQLPHAFKHQPIIPTDHQVISTITKQPGATDQVPPMTSPTSKSREPSLSAMDVSRRKQLPVLTITEPRSGEATQSFTIHSRSRSKYRSEEPFITVNGQPLYLSRESGSSNVTASDMASVKPPSSGDLRSSKKAPPGLTSPRLVSASMTSSNPSPAVTSSAVAAGPSAAATADWKLTRQVIDEDARRQAQPETIPFYFICTGSGAGAPRAGSVSRNVSPAGGRRPHPADSRAETRYPSTRGNCAGSSPCEHSCYDLQDGTYECACKSGYILNDNGYTCDLAASLTRAESALSSSPGPVLQPLQQDIQQDLQLPQEEPLALPVQQPRVKKLNTSSAEVSSCPLACGLGQCVREDADDEGEVHHRCACPLGTSGDLCETPLEVHWARFSGTSFAQLAPPVDAHTDMRLTLEFRPDDWHGLLLLSGESVNLEGDFMALLLVDGFVEFRFDCGSGLGVVRSLEPVLLDRWNRLTLVRTRSYVSMQLNGGQRTEGMSQGIFWHITFELSLYVGGARDVSGLRQRLGDIAGYRGCIRLLQINQRTLDFRPLPVGHLTQGWDIGECSGDLCSRLACEHGGKCISAPDGATSCLCPLGFLGELCQKPVDLQVPAFNGSSHLKFAGLGSSALTYLSLLVTVKPTAPSGIIVYNGFHQSGQGEFMALSMRDGHIEFAFDLGTGVTFVRTTLPVELHRWQEVRVSRTGREAVLQVAGQPAVVGRSAGGFSQLSLPQSLYVGGVASYESVSSELFMKDGLQGCVQKVVINDRPLALLASALSGYNVDNCAHPCVTRPCQQGTCEPRGDSFRCRCGLGSGGPRCRASLPPPQLPRFSTRSYLLYQRPIITEKLQGLTNGVEVEFRTRYPSGLLVWTSSGDSGWGGDFLAVAIQHGHVHMRFSLGAGVVTVTHNTSRVDDGQWHRVQASRVGRDGVLSVDGSYPVSGVAPGLLSHLDTDGRLFIGGTSDIEYTTQGQYRHGLDGCVAEVIVAPDHLLDLTDADDGRDVGHCL